MSFAKSLTAAALAAAFLLTGCSGTSNENKNTKEIGIIQLTDHEALNLSYKGFTAALEENGYKDGENINLDFHNAQNDQSNLKTISQKFVTDKKDLILAIATPAAQSVASETTEIPILITAVTDPADSKLVKSNDNPGTNVSGTSDLTPIKEQIELLKQIIPDVKKIAIVYCSGEVNSVLQADIAETEAKNIGIESERRTVTSTNDVAQVMESIAAGDFDAVYIPTDNTLASSMTLVSSILNEAKVPVIVGERSMLEAGALASVAIDYYKLGYTTGEMAVEILSGKSEPQSMPIRYLEDPELLINTSTVEKIGITIPSDIMEKASKVETIKNN